MAISEYDFGDCDNLAKKLSKQIANNLRQAIERDGSASIAVSGGSTPKKMLSELSNAENINWKKIDITLVDERFVNENSNRSNAKMIKQFLLQGKAKQANFFPLYLGCKNLDDLAIEKINQQQKLIKHPFDVVVLGMGLDGHTASFFPNTKNLKNALNSKRAAIAIKSSDDEQRITLTFFNLIKAKNIYLHIEGRKKQQILRLALKEGEIADMPIRVFLYQEEVPINIYSCA